MDVAVGDTLGRGAFMHDVSRQLAGALHSRRTIQRLLRLAVPYLGDWAMLVLFEEHGAAAFARSADGTVTGPVDAGDGTEPALLARLAAGGPAELLTRPVPEDLDQVIPDEVLCEQVVPLLPGELLGTGLTARDGTLGALVVLRTGGRCYRREDIGLVEEFADRAAVTLESAVLYEERARVASVLQAALRPPTLPEIPGVRVAARFRAAFEHLDIGGDFYDVHGADDDWLLVIGDVCGKGVQAAVLTGRARQTIRTAAHFDRSPSTILTALNDVLYEGEADRFVTVACARLRPAAPAGEFDVTLALAGHPAPMVLRADGRVEEPELAGTLSGVLPDLSYEEAAVRLRPGDAMLLFTDGIYEAKGPQGFFGLDRLRAMLPGYAGATPERLCAAVEHRVTEHLGGAAHDDMALLAVRCGDWPKHGP